MVRKYSSGSINNDPPQKWSAFQKNSGLKDLLSPAVKFTDPDRKYIHYQTDYPIGREINQPVQKKQHEVLQVLSQFIDSLFIERVPEALHKETEPDPHKVFYPSRLLTDLTNRHLDIPDETEARAYNMIRKFYREPTTNRFEFIGLEDIISQEVEGFLTNWASRIVTTDERRYISKGGRFLPDVCMGIIDRLQLDPYDPCPVLDRLFLELFQFVSQIPRQRGWGRINVKNAELSLEVNVEAFAIPKLEDLDEERWIELK